MEDVIKIDLAIEYLKNKVTLYTIIDKNKVYLKGNQINVRISNPNASYTISYNEFKSLYQKNIFFIYEETEFEIDTLKDEQYYKWNK